MTLHIVHLVSSAGYYGKEHVILELVRAMTGRNIAAVVGIMEQPAQKHQLFVDACREAGLSVRVFLCAGAWDTKTILGIRAYLKTKQTALIHCHDYKSDIYGYCASIGLPCKRIATVHNWIMTDRKLKLYAWIDKKVLHFFDMIVPVSPHIRSALVRAGIHREKLRLINNGINIAVCDRSTPGLKQSVGFADSHLIVGAVSRLSEEKGISQLLDAFKIVIKRIPQARLLIVGEGPLRGALQKKAKSLGLNEYVNFAGMRTDIPALLHIMDVFVLPSLVEGMPMALLEAMACKCPIVATDVGSVSSLIRPGETGLLIAPGNVAALAEAVSILFADRDAGRIMGGNAAALVAREYSSTRMADSYQELYERV